MRWRGMRRRGVADDEFGVELERGLGDRGLVDDGQEQGDGRLAHGADWLADGRQRRRREGHERRVVEADDGDVGGHLQAAPFALADRPQRHDVAAADQAGAAVVEEFAGRRLPALDGVERVGDVQGRVRQEGRHDLPVPLLLVLGGGEARGAEGQSDPRVSQGDEVADGLGDGVSVVGGHVRGVDLLVRAVERDEGDPHLLQAGVAGGRQARVGVQSAEEDDPRDPLVQEELDVGVLGDAARCLRAQQGSVSPGGHGRLEVLREAGEDRVGQFRDDEADEPAGPLAQPLGTLVSEQIEGGEHRLAGRGRHGLLAVEDARDGCRGHSSLASQIGQADSLSHGSLPGASLPPLPCSGRMRTGTRCALRKSLPTRHGGC